MNSQILFFLVFFLLSGFGIAGEKQAAGLNVNATLKCVKGQPEDDYTLCVERVKAIKTHCNEVAEFINGDCVDFKMQMGLDDEQCTENLKINDKLCHQKLHHDSVVCVAAYARDMAGCLPSNPEQAAVWENIKQASWQDSIGLITPSELFSLREEDSFNPTEVKCLHDDSLSYRFCINQVKDGRDFCMAKAGTAKVYCRDRAQKKRDREKCNKEHARSEAGCERKTKEGFIACIQTFTANAAVCMIQNTEAASSGTGN